MLWQFVIYKNLSCPTCFLIVTLTILPSRDGICVLSFESGWAWGYGLSDTAASEAVIKAEIAPDINPSTYGQMIFDKGTNTMQWGKASLFSKQDIHIQKNEVGPFSYTTYKNYLKMD